MCQYFFPASEYGPPMFGLKSPRLQNLRVSLCTNFFRQYFNQISALTTLKGHRTDKNSPRKHTYQGTANFLEA